MRQVFMLICVIMLFAASPALALGECSGCSPWGDCVCSFFSANCLNCNPGQCDEDGEDDCTSSVAVFPCNCGSFSCERLTATCIKCTGSRCECPSGPGSCGCVNRATYYGDCGEEDTIVRLGLSFEDLLVMANGGLLHPAFASQDGRASEAAPEGVKSGSARNNSPLSP